MELKATLKLTEHEVEVVKTCLVRVRGLLHDTDGNQNDMDIRCTEDINIVINMCEEAMANLRMIERKTVYIYTDK